MALPALLLESDAGRQGSACPASWTGGGATPPIRFGKRPPLRPLLVVARGVELRPGRYFPTANYRTGSQQHSGCSTSGRVAWLFSPRGAEAGQGAKRWTSQLGDSPTPLNSHVSQFAERARCVPVSSKRMRPIATRNLSHLACHSRMRHRRRAAAKVPVALVLVILQLCVISCSYGLGGRKQSSSLTSCARSSLVGTSSVRFCSSLLRRRYWHSPSAAAATFENSHN